VALVSKAWNQADRAAAFQPIDLAFDHTNYSLSALKWHLRDTIKLKTVKMHDCRSEFGNTSSKCTEVLLSHLAAKAPALKLLSMAFPIPAPEFGFLQLIGGLTQLEQLTIQDWRYSDDEIPCFKHLASLQNLKVSPCLCTSKDY
jgi:hypothetical protein